MVPRAIVLDFDGVVVLDSEYIKRHAWDGLLEKFPGGTHALERAVDRYVGGRYGTREDIVRDALREIGFDEDHVAKYVATYSARVHTAILASGVTLEDRAALTVLAGYARVYANSATPHDALCALLRDLGIESLFSGVYAGSGPKAERLRYAAEDAGVPQEELVFVGDRETDLSAANDVGCRFVCVSPEVPHWAQRVPVIAGLRDLPQLLHGT
ncbi:MAG: HAD family hydrolase [Minisyncoccia bacterium]